MRQGYETAEHQTADFTSDQSLPLFSTDGGLTTSGKGQTEGKDQFSEHRMCGNRIQRSQPQETLAS
jgi:hypothetical protein